MRTKPRWRVLGSVLVTAVGASLLATPAAHAAPAAVDETAVTNAIFPAYVRVQDSGPNLDKHFVLSADLLGWRKRNPAATAAELTAHLTATEKTINDNLTPYDLKRQSPDLIARMVEVAKSPDLGSLIGSVVGEATMQWVGKASDRISGAQQQFSTTLALYDNQTETWQQVATTSRADAPFREAWNGYIGRGADVDATITATAMAAKPQFASVIDVQAMLDKSSNLGELAAEGRRQAALKRDALNAERLKCLDAVRANAGTYPPGGDKKPDADAADAAEKAEKKRQEPIDQLKAGVDGIAAVVGLFDANAGKQIATVGKAAADVATAINKFATAAAVLGNLTNVVFSLASVALTGNILGAVSTIIGMFMSTGPSIEQLVMEEIEKLRQDIKDLHVALDKRFDKLDKTLNTIYDTMIAQFAMVNNNVDQVKSLAVAMAHQLSELQSQVQTVGTASLKAIGDLDGKDLLTASNQYLDYESKFGQKIPSYNEYITNAENKIHLAGTQTPTDAGFVPPENASGGYDSDDVDTQLNLYGSAGLVRYLSWYAHNQLDGSIPVPGSKTVGNAAVWQMAANAYSTLAKQNPEYASKVAASRGQQVASAGQNILNATKEFSKPSTDPNVPLNGLFTSLTGRYDSAITNYAGRFKEVENDVVSETAKSFSLFGPTNQSIPAGEAEKLPAGPDKFESCGLRNRAIDKPANVKGTDLGATAMFTRYLNNGLNYQPCWGVLTENPRFVDDGQNIYHQVDLRVWVFQRIDLPGGPTGVNVRSVNAIVDRGFSDQITRKDNGQVFKYDPEEYTFNN